jgi:hypothetical protein
MAIEIIITKKQGAKTAVLPFTEMIIHANYFSF